ncbi:host specificity protein J [Pseudomonas guariconensis]|uniref:host specificity protein J n=1 Tax=Pseudomonas guariconensis TaxID=1288410 RepID=UPI0018AB7071|nr:phage tail protein [Pseudomonas guariconensis]MBF8732791.1 host specificity protein J [Pseudomonas guariconensis]
MSELIHGAKGGGKGGGSSGSSRTPVEAPNTLRSAATARIIDLLGEGPIAGLVDGLKSVFLDDTPLQSSNGSYNFSGVTVTERTGEAIQQPISGFPAVENEVDVSTQVKINLPIVRTVSNLDTDAVRVKIRIPALTSQDTSTGDISGSYVAVGVDVQASGGSWVRKATVEISGKTTSPYERAIRVGLTGVGPWNVRVARLNADSTGSTVQNDTYWSSYTEITDVRLTYPDSAIIGLQVDARQFGTEIPSRSYDVKGRIIRVPSNYTPGTRAYTGLWDGTFKLAWTDNPAWIYLDLATHSRYGAGLENVDKWSLYQIAQYCDELVPNGYGAMEPRFTVNTVLAEQVEAIKALNQLASAFRGMTYWGSNSAVAAADMPSDPVKLVSPANVINGEFERSGTGLRERHSVALVTWNDPADSYKKQVEVVEDADAVRLFGWRQVDVTAFGCTSRGQAHRLGRWLLYSERAETDTITYTAGVDHADLRPGDIIALHDPSQAGARLSGRVRAPGLVELELDKVPDEVTGFDWFLDVMLPAGVIERRQVLAFAGNVATLAEPLSAVPVVAAMWVLSSLSVEPELFRVVSISEKEGAQYQVTAVEHDPDKYARVELGLSLPERDTSLIPTGPLPAPLNLTVDEYLYRAGVGVRSGASISVTPPADPRISLYEFQVWRPNESDYGPLSTQSDVTADLQDTSPGEYKIRVRALTVTGLRSPWSTVVIALQGLLRPPADITDLRLTVNAGQLTLWWPPVPDLDLDHYEIRYSPSLSGATWASAQVVLDRVAAAVNTAMLPARRGTYLVRAVDTSGVYSLNAISGTSEIADLDSYNAVEAVDEGPTWLGERVNVSSVLGQLQLDSRDMIASWGALSDAVTMAYGTTGLAEEGWYYADEIVDMGHVYTARLTSEIIAFGYDILGTMASWVTLASIDRLADVDPGQWGLTLEVSQSSTPQPAAPTDWSPWAPLTIGEHTARAFRFRLHLRSYAPAVTPSVSQMRIIVDMPDRVAGGNDLLCPAGGTRISFEPAFMVRPSLAVDAQGLSVGDRKLVTDIDDSGFSVRFFDSAGNGVARTFDYLAKGYGRRV